MFRHLFRCVNCLSSPSQTTFPLCEDCFKALTEAPPLCNKCAGLSCDDVCKRKWAESPPDLRIHSYSARYLLLGPGYPVLKSWKKNHGPALDRLILKANKTLEQVWNEFGPHLIIAVPQNPKRAWEMRGSPAHKIASWVARVTQIPLTLSLEIQFKEKRQAELTIYERLQNRIEFKATEDLCDKRILLVDDFVTTGKTTQAAAKACVEAGASQIHIFSLGVRPPAENQLESTGAASAAAPSVTSAGVSAKSFGLAS